MKRLLVARDDHHQVVVQPVARELRAARVVDLVEVLGDTWSHHAAHPRAVLAGGHLDVGPRVARIVCGLFERDVAAVEHDRSRLDLAAIGEHAGEDLSLSWRAREAGFTPWLIPECNPGHFKTVTIYPSGTVRNIVGEDINLVQVDEKLKTINELMVQEAKEIADSAAA